MFYKTVCWQKKNTFLKKIFYTTVSKSSFFNLKSFWHNSNYNYSIRSVIRLLSKTLTQQLMIIAVLVDNLIFFLMILVRKMMTLSNEIVTTPTSLSITLLLTWIVTMFQSVRQSYHIIPLIGLILNLMQQKMMVKIYFKNNAT